MVRTATHERVTSGRLTIEGYRPPFTLSKWLSPVDRPSGATTAVNLTFDLDAESFSLGRDPASVDCHGRGAPTAST